MAYDDGYYYGQCKLIFESITSSSGYVQVKNSSNTSFPNVTIESNKGEITVPGRDEYTITFGSFSKKIQCGYGECIKVVLADGYDPIIQKDFDELKDNLIADNGTEFQFAFKDNKYGYKVGADTFVPFLSGMKQLTSTGVQVTADKDYARAFAIMVNYGGSGTTSYSLTDSLTRTRGGSTTTESNKVYDPAMLKQPGITVKYTVYDLGELKNGDVIKRVASWSPTPSSGRYGGQLTVLVIE